ncbi:MAG: hypothetical protein K0U98_01260 [Deltaproteobacteria bacterium]|nr:hypothetical protein [Deltaproteobacteria bacterium]
MLENVSKSDFDKYLSQNFRLEAGDESLDLHLSEVSALSEAARVPEGREPFSVIFLGPKNRHLDQQIYTVSHPQLGTLEVFLVPLGPDKDNSGLRFEAVFT